MAPGGVAGWRRSVVAKDAAPLNSRKPIGRGGGQKNLGAICFAKSALHGPVWPIIRNILLPSRHKNTDLGAPSFQNRLSINLFYSHNAPKSTSLFGRIWRSAGTSCPPRLTWQYCRWPPERNFPSRRIMKVRKQPKAAEAVDAREAFPRPSPPGRQLLPPRRQIANLPGQTSAGTEKRRSRLHAKRAHACPYSIPTRLKI